VSRNVTSALGQHATSPAGPKGKRHLGEQATDARAETFGVQALTPVAMADQVPTMRFVPPSFQIGSGPNFEIPVGLFPPAPSFLAALEPRQVNQRARINSRLRSLRRIFASSPLRLPGITGGRACCASGLIEGEALCPHFDPCRPSFHRLHLGALPVRSAKPR
jgi:hypothetical protein